MAACSGIKMGYTLYLCKPNSPLVGVCCYKLFSALTNRMGARFCQCLLTKISSEPDIAIPLPLAAVEATTNLQPHHPPDMQAAQ